MQRKPKLLVIGAAGFLGQHLVNILLNKEVEVVGLDVVDLDRYKKFNIEHVVGSLSDENLVSSVASECEAVFYLASSSLPATANADLAAEISIHVRTAVKTAEICQSMGVQKFIFASSGGTVYGSDSFDPLTEDEQTNPRNAYGVSKLSIEKYLSVLSCLHNMKTISLRISNPYGILQKSTKGQGFIAAAIKAGITENTLPIWGSPNIVRDFIYASDVAEAFFAAYNYEGPSTIVNIGSGKGTSLQECISIIEKSLGKRINVDIMPNRSIDVAKSILNIEKSANLFDWRPKVPIESGIKSTVDWWLNNI